MRTLPEKYNMVQGVEPKTTNAAITSRYVSLKNGICAFVIVHLTQAVAHATPITLFQATDVSGTSAKAIASNVQVWANEDVAAGDALIRRTDGVGYTVTADVKNKMVVFQIEPERLDINNGFTTIQARIGASSQVTNFASVEILIDAKYEQSTPPSAVIN